MAESWWWTEKKKYILGNKQPKHHLKWLITKLKQSCGINDNLQPGVTQLHKQRQQDTGVCGWFDPAWTKCAWKMGTFLILHSLLFDTKVISGFEVDGLSVGREARRTAPGVERAREEFQAARATEDGATKSKTSYKTNEGRSCPCKGETSVRRDRRRRTQTPASGYRFINFIAICSN